MSPPDQPAKILLVEDDGMDVRIFERAARIVGLPAEIVVVPDGADALSYLRDRPRDATRDRDPSLIILDLNMPKMTGLEFLGVLRSDPKLTHHVVFVLTTSSAPHDRQRAYEMHVAGYMTKDSDFDAFRSKVELLRDYLQKIDLPRRAASGQD